MINQEQYRKAILSELGITQWRLSEANLLDGSHLDSNPNISETNTSNADISERLEQIEQAPASSETTSQETQLTPSQTEESQPAEINSEEPVLAQPAKEAIDVTGKLVIEASLKARYPTWFWQDLSLALNCSLEEIIWLTDLQSPKGEALCDIRAQNVQSGENEDNSEQSGQDVSDVQLLLPVASDANSQLSAGSKKSLWDKLQAVLKSSQ